MATLTQDQAGDTTSRIETVLSGLKPIQDLVKNWDIDIASCLEEYLIDVGVLVGDRDEMDQQGDNNTARNNFNFAKAALVLQNSSHVYSRKVEYLHSLVLSALERMSKTTVAAAGNGQKKNSRGGKEDPEVDEFWEFDPHQNFLLLDDVLPVDNSSDGRHINLAITPQEAELSRRLTWNGNNRSNEQSTLAPTPSRTSSYTGTTTTRSNLTSSTAGSDVNAWAWVGSNLANSNCGATSGALRLMNGVCELDPETGRLILPGSETRKVSSTPAPPGHQLPRFSCLTANENPADFSSEQGYNHFAPVNENGDDGNDDGGGCSFGGDDDNDNDGPGFAFADENQPPLNGPVTTLSLNHNAAADDNTNAARKTHFASSKPDPWALLDPHEPKLSCTSSKPLRLGKTLRKPACLTKKAGRRGDPPPDAHPPPRYISLQLFRHLTDPDYHPRPEFSWKELVYAHEFSDLAREAQTIRKAAKLRRERQERLLNRLRLSKEDEDDNENLADPVASVKANAYDQGDDDGYMADDWGTGDDGHYIDNDDDKRPIETNTGLTNFDQIYRRVDMDENDSQADARAFEDMCRAHIERFARGAEKYAASTNLTQRVDQWQERLAPILAQEEERRAFDIHLYCREVIDCVQEVLECSKHQHQDDDGLAKPRRLVDFADVVKGRSQYEVCRIFLACLSLCNAENILLLSAVPKEKEESNKSVELPPVHIELLSTTINVITETYLTPTEAERQEDS